MAVREREAVSYHLGVDLGGTTVHAVAVTDTGDVLAHEMRPTNDDGTDSWVSNVLATVEALTSPLGGPPRTAGLCAPGIAAPDGACINWMPGRLAGLEGLGWSDYLNLNTPVRVLNDAQSALLAETWIGAAKSRRNVALLTIGTGVGGALLCDGRLLRGHIGRAGHLGHMSLDPAGTRDIVNTPGSLEDAIGECTLPQRSNGRWPTSKELVAAVESGDAEAKEVWHTSIRALAAAIASIENAFDPEIVLIGGGTAQAGESFFAPLRVYHDEFEWRPGRHRVTIESVVLGDHAGALGAARYGMNFKDLTK